MRCNPDNCHNNYNYMPLNKCKEKAKHFFAALVDLASVFFCSGSKGDLDCFLQEIVPFSPLARFRKCRYSAGSRELAQG